LAQAGGDGGCDARQLAHPRTTALPGFCINGGWGTGGFKAIPAGGTTFAHLLATGTPHPLGRPFGLDRFTRSRLYDQGAAAGIAH